MSHQSPACVVLCTCPDLICADRLAAGLVSQRLAACVNRLGPVTSVYEWQGEICRDEEYQLVIKTRQSSLAPLEQWLKAQHPYEVPEIVALEANRVEHDYHHWLNQALDMPALETTT